VKLGTLWFTNVKGLGDQTEVHLADGATLDLNFTGEMRIGKLYLDEKLQPAGSYSAVTTPKFIKGKGILKTQ